MTQNLTQLRLQVDAMPEEDIERLGEVTRQLRQEILELDIEKVDADRTAELPEGARGDPFTIGALILTLATSGGVFTKLIDTLQSWLKNRNRNSLSLEIGGDKLTLVGNPTSSQQQLIDLFISHHAR
jgi:hypothetical protein